MKDIELNNCEKIICLGDLVEGGDKNEEVVFELKNRNITSVRGNHDEINNLFLAKNIQEYLLNLPEQMLKDNILYTHISLRKSKRKIKNNWGQSKFSATAPNDSRLINIAKIIEIRVRLNLLFSNYSSFNILYSDGGICL